MQGSSWCNGQNSKSLQRFPNKETLTTRLDKTGMNVNDCNESFGISLCSSWNSADFYIQMNILNNFLISLLLYFFHYLASKLNFCIVFFAILTNLSTTSCHYYFNRTRWWLHLWWRRLWHLRHFRPAWFKRSRDEKSSSQNSKCIQGL